MSIYNTPYTILYDDGTATEKSQPLLLGDVYGPRRARGDFGSECEM